MAKPIWGSAINGVRGDVQYLKQATHSCPHEEVIMPGQPCPRCIDEGVNSTNIFVTAPLSNQDVERCVRSLSTIQREVLIEYPEQTMVAGGFVRSVIAGDRIKDVDYFVPDLMTANKMVDFVYGRMRTIEALAQSEAPRHDTEKAVTIAHKNYPWSQFIHKWVYEDPSEILALFDFTVCQAAFWYGLDKRWRGICGSRFYPDLAARRLVYTNPIHRDDQDVRLILRIIKHLSLGYQLSGIDLAEVMTQIYVNCHEAVTEAKSPQIPRGVVHEYLSKKIEDASVSPTLEELSKVRQTPIPEETKPVYSQRRTPIWES